MKKTICILLIAILISASLFAAKTTLSVTGATDAVLFEAMKTKVSNTTVDDYTHFALLPEQNIFVQSNIYFDSATTLGMAVQLKNSPLLDVLKDDSSKTIRNKWALSAMFSYRFLEKREYLLDGNIGLGLGQYTEKEESAGKQSYLLFFIPMQLGFQVKLARDWNFFTAFDMKIPFKTMHKMAAAGMTTRPDTSITGVQISVPVGITYQIM